jgi:hypothetical protein
MTRLIYSSILREYLRHKPIAETNYCYLLWDFNSDIVKKESTPTATRSVIANIPSTSDVLQ